MPAGRRGRGEGPGRVGGIEKDAEAVRQLREPTRELHVSARLGLAESMQATGAGSEPTTCDEAVHMSSNIEAASNSAGTFVQKRITTLHQHGNPSG